MLQSLSHNYQFNPQPMFILQSKPEDVRRKKKIDSKETDYMEFSNTIQGQKWESAQFCFKKNALHIL